MKFSAASRLRSRHEFTAVQERGRRVAARYVTLLGLPNALDRDRLGVVASRKVGGAVVRNRAKRRLRELFRRVPANGRPANAGTPADQASGSSRIKASASFAELDRAPPRAWVLRRERPACSSSGRDRSVAARGAWPLAVAYP